MAGKLRLQHPGAIESALLQQFAVPPRPAAHPPPLWPFAIRHLPFGQPTALQMGAWTHLKHLLSWHRRKKCGRNAGILQYQEPVMITADIPLNEKLPQPVIDLPIPPNVPDAAPANSHKELFDFQTTSAPSVTAQIFPEQPVPKSICIPRIY
jgi:hypothetical protein